uniref:Uncharacterized protein n=1 Tax=Chrysotila carterae TaxID=13221 RepID=A0A7S4BLM3_CHRCT
MPTRKKKTAGARKQSPTTDKASKALASNKTEGFKGANLYDRFESVAPATTGAPAPKALAFTVGGAGTGTSSIGLDSTPSGNAFGASPGTRGFEFDLSVPAVYGAPPDTQGFAFAPPVPTVTQAPTRTSAIGFDPPPSGSPASTDALETPSSQATTGAQNPTGAGAAPATDAHAPADIHTNTDDAADEAPAAAVAVDSELNPNGAEGSATAAGDGGGGGGGGGNDSGGGDGADGGDGLNSSGDGGGGDGSGVIGVGGDGVDADGQQVLSRHLPCPAEFARAVHAHNSPPNHAESAFTTSFVLSHAAQHASTSIGR